MPLMGAALGFCISSDMTLTLSLEVQEMWCLNKKQVPGAVGHGGKDMGTRLEFCFHHSLGTI